MQSEKTTTTISDATLPMNNERMHNSSSSPIRNPLTQPGFEFEPLITHCSDESPIPKQAGGISRNAVIRVGDWH